MLSILLALVLASPPSISYETVAKPLVEVLRDLSEDSGVEMRASKAIENDKLVIRVRDADISKIREKIAEAVAGKWSEKVDIFTIERDEVRERKHFDDEVNRRMSHWRDTLARTRFMPQLGGATIEDIVGKGHFVADIYQIATQIVSNIDVRQIVAMPPDDRLVYSTAPTGMQLPLPNMDSLLESAIADHNRIAEVAAKVEVEPPVVGTQQETLRNRMLQKWKMPLRIMIVAESQPDAANVTVLLVDPSRRVLASASMGPSFHMQHDLPNLPSGVIGSESIVLSKTASKFAELMSHIGMERLGAGLAEIDEETREVLKSPVLNDPLTFQLLEALLGLSEKTRWQLVASVRDEMVPITPGYVFTVQSVLSDIVGAHRLGMN